MKDKSIDFIFLFFPAADTLLSIWGVWGANQILLSLFYLAVVTRYRGLLPFAILLFTLEFWSGILVGNLLGKKVTSKRTPPGNMAKWIISLIIGPVLFWMSLPQWYGFLQMIFAGQNCGLVSRNRPVSTGFYKGFLVSFLVLNGKKVRFLQAYYGNIFLSLELAVGVRLKNL